MFLGVDELLKRVEDDKLVVDLSERELTYPEGAGFDLRLGEVFTVAGEGYLGITERQTAPATLVMAYDPDKIQSIEVKPGDFYLVKTIEKVNMPDNLLGIFKPRSTLQRMGCFLRTAQVAPGYSGELTFALANVGPVTVKIELGARIVHIMFTEIKGSSNLYRGQWQGGRVTADKKETQV